MQDLVFTEFLTTEQLAELVHMNPQVLERWRRDGNGPPFVRFGPRKVLYLRCDVDSWIASRRFTHRAEEAVSQANT